MSDGRTIVASVDKPGEATLPALDDRTATREQLIARATVQQNEIVTLRKQVQELERRASGSRDESEPGRAWYDPSPETLAAWAGECRVRADMPDLDRWQPMTSLGKNDRGLEPAELPAVNAAMAEVQAQWKTLLKSLYLEATGDTAGAETLSMEAMRREIEEKTDPRDHNYVLQRIAQERAGQIPPPADLSKTSPFERMFRAYIKLGEQTEQALAKRLGAERAKAIRGDAWGSRSNWSGCPKQDSDE